MIVNKTVYPASATYSSIDRLQTLMDKLEIQLATGKRANKLSEAGNTLAYDLTLRSKLSRIEGYQNNIQQLGLRLNVMGEAMGRLDAIESEARANASILSIGEDGVAMVSAPTLAQTQLDEVLSLLNTDVNGRYLFAGSTTDSKPVEGLDAILNGAGGRDGFRTVASQRLQADLGDDGLGRLDVSTVASTTTLAEDGVHVFGLKLSTASTDSPGLAITGPAGSPMTMDFQFTALPAEGDKVYIGFTLPDGTSQTLELTATTGTPASVSQFQIGADPDATAANFQAALEASITAIGQTSLTAASNFEAAENFFNATGETVMRVDGPPYDTATSLVAATSSDTVQWYTGSDSPIPRQSVNAKISDHSAVSYGAEGNESGFAAMVRTLAVMSIQNFDSSSTSDRSMFTEISTRTQSNLSESHNGEAGSIELVTLELSTAQVAAKAASERHTNYNAQLETMLSELEEAPIEEVAMQLLALQTRLDASYSTLAKVSQLSLVNYL